MLKKKQSLFCKNKNPNKTLVNILLVVISNLIKLGSGLLIGFIIPKIMGEINYGYYKTYLLYMGYVGLLHFGFPDGIYLIYAGNSYDDIDKNKFNIYTKFTFIFQTIISLLFCIPSLFFINTDLGFIFFIFGLSNFATQITNYFQIISQVVGRFKELSIRNILQASLQLITTVVLWLFYHFKIISILSYKIYLIVYLFTLLFLAIWYIFSYKQIVFFKSAKILSEKKRIISLFKIGFPLLIVNLIVTLLLGINRQFANILALQNIISMADFGIYSFADSLVSLIINILSPISIVIYPVIKNVSEERIKNKYINITSLIFLISSLSLLAYHPIAFIVNNFLPTYKESLIYFINLLPSAIFTSIIMILIFNIYKSINKQVIFFVISVSTLLIAIISNIVLYLSIKTLYVISYVPLAITFLWYIVSDIYIAHRWKLFYIKNYLYIILILISFYLSVYLIENEIISFVIYFFCFIILSLIFFVRTIFEIRKESN